QKRYADQDHHQQRGRQQQRVAKERLVARQGSPTPPGGRQRWQADAGANGHRYSLNLALAAAAASARIFTPSSTDLPCTTIACSMSFVALIVMSSKIGVRPVLACPGSVHGTIFCVTSLFHSSSLKNGMLT